LHYIDIAIFALGYFILPHSVHKPASSSSAVRCKHAWFNSRSLRFNCHRVLSLTVRMSEVNDL